MKTYKLYRNGAATLTERIGKAIEHYTIHNGGRLPAAVIVNPRDEAETKAAVSALDLSLTVITDGGPLAGEVWLLVAGNGGSGDLGNGDLSTGSHRPAQDVSPTCNGAQDESLPDVV
jgi:hypothetical protein